MYSAQFNRLGEFVRIVFFSLFVVGSVLNGRAFAGSTTSTSTTITSSIGMEFVTISPGSFEMGCTPEQLRCASAEKPVHTVSLTRGFQIQTTEVTQGQYRAVMGNNPSHFSSCGLDCPVEKVRWVDAIKFANALSKKEGLTPAYSGTGDSIRWDKSASGYRLPTEAEWEYAARAGSLTVFSGSNGYEDVAWTWSNSEKRTHRVGTKQPNGWGLYDMSGNVAEWCWDFYDDTYYSSSQGADPDGPKSGLSHVFRGGSWGSNPGGGRVAFRYGLDPNNPHTDPMLNTFGLRLVRTSP
jgi:sulfatase modifying factor 1